MRKEQEEKTNTTRAEAMNDGLSDVISFVLSLFLIFGMAYSLYRLGALIMSIF